MSGDPWTPLVKDGDDYKGLTVNPSGWTYKSLVPLLFPTDGTVILSPLQSLSSYDSDQGYSVVARVIVRNQPKGRTEGFHERRIPVSGELKRRISGSRMAIEPAAKAAHDRVRDLGTVSRKVLYPAVLAALTGAPNRDAGERSRDDDPTKDRANRVVRDFDRRVDLTFFDDLDAEIQVLDRPDAAFLARARWISDRLKPLARTILDEAIESAPGNGARAWRVRVQATGLFEGLFAKTFGDFLRIAEAQGHEEKEHAT